MALQTSVNYSGSSTTGQENELTKHEQLATSSEGIHKLVGENNNSFSVPTLVDDWLRYWQRKRRKTTKRSREFRTFRTRRLENHYLLDCAAAAATVSFGRETGQRESEPGSTDNNFFSDSEDQASWYSARVPGTALRFQHRLQPHGVALCNDSPTALSSEISSSNTSFVGAEVGGIRTVELPLCLYWSSQDPLNYMFPYHSA